MINICHGKSMANWHGLSLIKYNFTIFFPRIGDVICFKGNDGKRYAHRVVSRDIENNCVTTKGDNLPKSNNYEIDIPIRNIEGIVNWSWPNEIQKGILG